MSKKQLKALVKIANLTEDQHGLDGWERSTHYEGCHLRHVGCLAVIVNQIALEGLDE